MDVDANANANANADAGGSTIALRECCSGELKIDTQVRKMSKNMSFSAFLTNFNT